jgi:hypothetical protein
VAIRVRRLGSAEHAMLLIQPPDDRR